MNINTSALLILSYSRSTSSAKGHGILLFSLKYSSSVISELKLDPYKSVIVYEIFISSNPSIYPCLMVFVIYFSLGWQYNIAL